MATFTATITYPDGKAAELRDIFCSAFDYDNNKLNAETKLQFVQRMANQHMREWVSNTFKSEKERLALLTADNNLNATI